jgi:subtilisin family serine protease
MKKVLFGSKASSGGPAPFWQPWGAGGWLLRLLGFLVLLFALLLLLNLFQSRKKKPKSRADVPEVIMNPTTPDPAKVPIDDSVNFPHDIQDPGPNLPSPGDNNIPPLNPDDIISDDGRQIVGNRLNVVLNSSADDQTYKQFANEFKSLYPGQQYRVVYYDKMTKLMQLEVPQAERDAIMKALPQQITDISFKVFPDGLMGNMYKPNDLVFSDPGVSWYYGPIQAYEAWDITQGSPDVVVAICDSYFDLNHDDLNSNRIVKPYSVPTRTSNVAPVHGCDQASFFHGSMVASQALGTMDNQRGTCGIAPKCKFMPVSLGHQMTSMTILQGLLYAIYQGADVVNLSVGALLDPALKNMSIQDQIALSKQMCLQEQAVWDFVADLARQRNVTIVWAAGNDNLYTALDASKRGNASIKVSAVDSELHKADFSNYGNFPQYNAEESTISAPGVDIIGAMPYNTYNIGPGTSFAAPIVTGAVALMKSLDKTLTTAEIIDILQATGKPVDGGSSIGKLIQIRDALLMVKGNFAKFDDIMSDHDKLLGLWMSTELNPIFVNSQPTGMTCRNYYDVKTTSSGTSICYATDTHKDYTTTFTITWNTDEIVLQEASNLINPTDKTYNFIPSTIVCRPDSANLLKCVATAQGGHTETYYLRKVKKRQD